MYTIPTLSRTAMHYAYNTDTTDTVPDGALVDVTLFDTNRVLYRYDYLQRQSNKIIKEKPGQNESVEDKRTILEETYAYAPGTGENTTTNRVSTKRVFWNNALIHQFQHGYDALGNITNIYDAVTLKRVNYTYDDQGQLLTATHYNNSTKTHTETYTYDNVGNILTFNNGTTSHTYTYGDTQWQDLLTAVDGNEITYDASGNPTEYHNNWTMTWVEGRRLESVTVGSNTYTYQYNADGQRTKKTNPDGSYIEYHVVNGVTVGESHYGADKKKTHNIRYTLDENNTVIGFTTGGVNYYFAKNLQGDILEVYNASTNEVVAQYTYDSWGNILTSTGSMKDTNPFRYRGYYYDSETGFYYLQSRYYDAGIGRFINADTLSSTGTGILGYNMFAYCNNNPIIYEDRSGHLLQHTVMMNDSTGGDLHVGTTNSADAAARRSGQSDDKEFAVSKEVVITENGAIKTGKLLSGSYDFFSIGSDGFTLFSFDFSAISLDAQKGSWTISPLKLGNISISAGFEKWIPKLEAMASLLSPSVSYDFGEISLTVTANLGAVGFVFKPSPAGFEVGYANGVGLTISVT